MLKKIWRTLFMTMNQLCSRVILSLVLAFFALVVSSPAQIAKPQPPPDSTIINPIQTDELSTDYTSVSQLKDVKSSDSFYEDLQSLVERYGVIVAYRDGTYRAGKPLTRAHFVMFLNQALGRINELAAASDENIDVSKFQKTYSANRVAMTSISQVKDVRSTDYFYTDLESLIERYGIDLTDSDGRFRAEKSVTEKDFVTWLGAILPLDFNNKNPSTANVVSRGAFAIGFNGALNNVSETIAEYKSEPKTETPKRRAVITDTGKLYTTINTTSCLKWDWATPEQKRLAGSGGWGSFYPQAGNEGEIVYETTHCDGTTKMYVLKVGSYYVPIGANGVRIGGGSEAAKGFAAITDAGQLYSTINTTVCLDWSWATPEQKRLSGSGGWNGYYPKNGEQGEVIYVTKHCDSSVKIYILKIGNYYVPMGETGVRLVDSIKQTPVAATKTVEEYFQLGSDCYDKKDYNCAIANYTKVIALAPNYAAAYTNRGNAYDDDGDSALALADYNKAIQLEPTNANSYYNRGVTYAKIKNYEQAVRDYTKAIQFDPKYKDAYHNRAIAYRKLNRIALAQADEAKEAQLK